MLMMARREGEAILIGDDIEIVIAHIGRSRVKVGIRAPREMPVIAREVQMVRDENLAAAAGFKISAIASMRELTGKRPALENERISRCPSRSKPT